MTAADRKQLHEQFRELLGNARGNSEFVIAASLDIRGFSAFAMNVESVQTAAYLRRVYMRVIDAYISGASFFKPTGDGLMVVFPCEDNVEIVAANILRSLTKLLLDFPKLSKGDALINFNVPELIGIGISRGAATRLVSGGITLDYSGRPLNIASRLMGLARPSGIIFDSSYGDNLVPLDLKPIFDPARIYLRGISGDSLTEVHYTKDLTHFPQEVLVAPKTRWVHLEEKRSLGSWKAVSRSSFTILLSSLARDRDSVIVKASFASPTDIAADVQTEYQIHDFEYVFNGPRPFISLTVKGIEDFVGMAEEGGVEDEAPVRLSVDYIEA